MRVRVCSRIRLPFSLARTHHDGGARDHHIRQGQYRRQLLPSGVSANLERGNVPGGGLDPGTTLK